MGLPASSRTCSIFAAQGRLSTRAGRRRVRHSDGSIWPVNEAALEAAVGVELHAGDERRARAVEEHQRPRLLLGDRVATERHREVVHVLLADGLLELRHHRRVGRARVEAVDADAPRRERERPERGVRVDRLLRQAVRVRELGRVRLAPRACARRSRASRAARPSSSMFGIQPMPAVDAMLAIARSPSTMFGITASVSCRSPQKFTSITSRSENVFGRPAQLNSTLTIAADLVDRRRRSARDRAGRSRVKLARPGHVGLLDVDRVHLGAEVDEDPRRRRAHARRRAGDDHALARRSRARPSARASLLDRDRALRAVLGAESRLVRERAVDLG